jgi:steroid 5-alpha reductase family enzyme
MFDFKIWLDGLVVIAVFAAVGWLLSLPLRNVSIVDSMWSLMFLLAALTYTAAQVSPGPRAWLVITLVGLWSIRLAAYISWRNRGHGEDFRYQAIRANNQPGFAFKSLYIVFGLQATPACGATPAIRTTSVTSACGGACS